MKSQLLKKQIAFIPITIVRTLGYDIMNTGAHTLTWHARNENGNAMSAGIYFLKWKHRVKSKRFNCQ